MATTETVRPSTSRWYSSWQLWLGGMISVAVMAWIVWALDWGQVWGALRSAHVGWIALAVATVLLTMMARVLRWRGLFLPQRFSFITLLTALLVGQVVNYMILSQLGIVARAVVLGQGNRVRALGTVILEKLWDVVMLLGLVAVLSVGLTLPDWLVSPARLLTVASVGALLSLLALFLLRGRLSLVLNRLPLFARRWFSALADGLEGVIRPRVFLWGLGGSLVVWGLGAATNYCVLRAFGLLASVGPVLLLLAALQAGIAVPSLPGSVGVFEGICIAVLALFGVRWEEALAAGLVLHVVIFVPPLLLGIVALWQTSYRASMIR